MATRTRTPRNEVNGYKLAAIAAQIASFCTTWMFIDAIGIKGLSGFIVSLIAEAVLMQGKELLLSGRAKADPIGIACVIIDTLFNAAGLFPYVDNIDQTEVWKLFTVGLGFTGNMQGVAAFVVAGALGLLLAIAPHQLWAD